ncbi:hypothetical protein Taro_027724 [Colocasia esculenta]|uniref:Uncharacterized protein n=1 Tax=Colocasia esculenta TaxID=4460 RepID=A0A843VKY7_COLES|nr:hypothetical protein [Colocasia esculenta]
MEVWDVGAFVVRLWSHVVAPVASFPTGSECELQESVADVARCACYKRGCWFARAAVGFVVGLCIRVGSEVCCPFGLCILVKVLPRIAPCHFWRRFFLGVLSVCFGLPLCCPCDLKCVVWLSYVLVGNSLSQEFVVERSWWRFVHRALLAV